MADDNECKVYVGSLNFKTTEEGLERYFSSCGTVIDGKLYFVSLSSMISRELRLKIFSF